LILFTQLRVVTTDVDIEQDLDLEKVNKPLVINKNKDTAAEKKSIGGAKKNPPKRKSPWWTRSTFPK